MEKFGIALFLSFLILGLTFIGGMLLYAFAMVVVHNPKVALWVGAVVLVWLALATGLWWWDRL